MLEAQLEEVRRQVDELAAREATAKRRERIVELLEEHGLPSPSASDASAGSIVSRQFMQSLVNAGDDESLERLVEERAALVRSACEWTNGRRRSDRRPRSRDQVALSVEAAGGRPQNAAEFAAAVRGG